MPDMQACTGISFIVMRTPAVENVLTVMAIFSRKIGCRRRFRRLQRLCRSRCPSSLPSASSSLSSPSSLRDFGRFVFVGKVNLIKMVNIVITTETRARMEVVALTPRRDSHDLRMTQFMLASQRNVQKRTKTGSVPLHR